MSLEKEIEVSLDEDSRSFHESEKHSKLSYTRGFLLSLSALDVCKQLPSGFNQSLLSEFEDGYHGIKDRQRNPGLPLQSHRHTDYSSSPPTRGDSSSYSRGVYGRWDNRSSGRSDRDSDSQSDRDSDSGRPYGTQSKRSWQSSEHDGLLGSGSFARPPGFATELSGPRSRSYDQYQLKRSNEPYHPPRPYKAGPHSRREISDSLNDETFGSADCTSQDRAEEERRRRESFELMRKKQLKVLQENQKPTTDKLKDSHSSNIGDLVDIEAGKRAFNKIAELEESESQSVLNIDSTKSPLQNPGARPLVPPGFRSTVVEKNVSTTSLAKSRAVEAGKPDPEESFSYAEAIEQNGALDYHEDRQLVQKMDLVEGPHDDGSFITASQRRSEHLKDLSTSTEIYNGKLGAEDQLYKSSCLSEVFETQSVHEIAKVETKKVTGHNIVDHSKQDQSSSILDKLFGTILIENLTGSSGLMEHQVSKQGGQPAVNVIQSSKFAQWFLEDERKGSEDPSLTRPSDLVSLINGEKDESQASDVKSPPGIPSDFPFLVSEITEGQLTSDTNPSTIGLPEKFFNSSKGEAVPPILTCEDLEQTILSEYSGSSSTSQKTLQGQIFCGPEEPKAATDDLASQHLLSLLQKGVGPKDMTVSSVSEGGPSGKKVENVTHSGKPLTLETLFGSAFMKELQSAEAPVSGQRGSVGSAVKSNENGSSSIHESQKQLPKSSDIESRFEINDTQVELDSMKRLGDDLSGGSGGAIDIQLPEEESLIAVSDPIHARNSTFNPFGSIDGELQSSNKPLDISDKLAALTTAFKDERSVASREGTPLMRAPHGPMEHEIPFNNLHAQSSSPQFHPTPHMNHGRLFFHHLDSPPTHASSQMNFNAPEGMLHRGGPSNSQFPAIMMRPPFRHPSAGPAGFDPHSMLQQMQQMQMQRQTPNNFPHHQQEMTRSAPLPPHLRTHATGSLQELYPMQGFPFDQQRPNFGGPGMAMQAPEVRGNHPEAFQRLLEMELRANSSKRIHPFASLGNNQGVHGHDLDMGFRFR